MNLVATPESASLDGPQCLSLQYGAEIGRHAICSCSDLWFPIKEPCNPRQPHPMVAKLLCSKRRVSSQPPATKLFSSRTAANCAKQCMIPPNLRTWKCGHVMHKAKRRKSTSWRVLDVLWSYFTDFSSKDSCVPCTSVRFM